MEAALVIYLLQLLEPSLCVNVYCIFGMLPLAADSVRLSSNGGGVHSIVRAAYNVESLLESLRRLSKLISVTVQNRMNSAAQDVP